MAAVYLDISDGALRLTLDVMLQVEGHRIVEKGQDLTICDSVNKALQSVHANPVLVLVPFSQVPDAIMAMQQGVRDYALLPLQPGEIPLLVARILDDSFAKQDSGVNNEGSEELLLKNVEKEHILRVLRLCKGNQVQAARRLGIGRNTLWRKLKAYKAEDEEAPEEDQMV